MLRVLTTTLNALLQRKVSDLSLHITHPAIPAITYRTIRTGVFLPYTIIMSSPPTPPPPPPLPPEDITKCSKSFSLETQHQGLRPELSISSEKMTESIFSNVSNLFFMKEINNK